MRLCQSLLQAGTKLCLYNGLALSCVILYRWPLSVFVTDWHWAMSVCHRMTVGFVAAALPLHQSVMERGKNNIYAIICN